MPKSGWLYLIKNGDLYKIGITKKLESRMRQLKPDFVVAKLYSSEFKQLEREFHKRYKNVRIPQTEYFRLDHFQIKEIKQKISHYYYPHRISLLIILQSIFLVLVIFLFLALVLSLSINSALVISLLLMERISIGLSILSLLSKSDIHLSFMNELKFRLSRVGVFILLAFLFRLVSRFF